MCKELKHEPLSRFIRREKEDVCIHVQSVDRLFIERTIAEQTDNFNEDYTVDQLSASPLLVAVFVEDEGYGIVQLESSSTSKPKLVCASCKTNVHFCEHVKAYKNWSKHKTSKWILKWNIIVICPRMSCLSNRFQTNVFPIHYLTIYERSSTVSSRRQQLFRFTFSQ